jgi:hypothetical protein
MVLLLSGAATGCVDGTPLDDSDPEADAAVSAVPLSEGNGPEGEPPQGEEVRPVDGRMLNRKLG